MIYEDSSKNILVVDDEPANLQSMRQILMVENYRLFFARSGAEALKRVAEQRIDLILLDIIMPEMDGYEVCQRLKENKETHTIPVIFVTCMDDVDDETRGFDLGAVDYITKPVSAPIVLARVKTHLSLIKATEVEKSRELIIQRLGRAAEYRDNQTGRHVIRMSHYAALIAKKIGWSEEGCNMLFNASPMHDVGKIGIPDKILLKPGKLTDDEWQVMKTHSDIGANIIGGADIDSPLLDMASTLALSHHEKWDGSGYPFGLAGEDIPVVARIAAIADVFDALTSGRVYKTAWSQEEALVYLKEQSGIHFDPRLVDAFLESLPEVYRIMKEFVD